MAFGALNYTVFAVYMGSLVVIGPLLAGKQKTTESYFLAAIPATIYLQLYAEVHFIYYFPFSFVISFVVAYVASVILGKQLGLSLGEQRFTIWGRGELEEE